MTKKVVINNCYGGFRLSLRGLEELAKLKGDGELFHYELDYGARVYKKVTSEQNEKSRNHGLFVSTLTKDLGNEVSEQDFHERSVKHFYGAGEVERHDPELINVVEKLGTLANTRVSDLKIVEIPKEIDYQIEDYDGVEWVAEKHRTWS